LEGRSRCGVAGLLDVLPLLFSLRNQKDQRESLLSIFPFFILYGRSHTDAGTLGDDHDPVDHGHNFGWRVSLPKAKRNEEKMSEPNFEHKSRKINTDSAEWKIDNMQDHCYI